MFMADSPTRTSTLVVCFILFTKACSSLQELGAAEDKPFELTCSGNVTKTLKHIWWTSNGRFLSTCYLGNENCTNNDAIQFTATNYNKYQKYRSKLTIHNVRPHHRDQTFRCVDDGSEDKSAEQLFILRVFHVPESPICEAEQLSRGRLKVACKTAKVFPTITCEISQEFDNSSDAENDGDNFISEATTTDIMYDYSKDRTIDYYSARCSTILCTRQSGVYRFKVKMYPNMSKALVTSVDGYTNTIRIQPSSDSCGEVVESEYDGGGEQLSKTIMINAIKAEALTGEENKRQTGQKTNNELETNQPELICQSDNAIIRGHLTVILVLTCLLVCTLVFNVLPLFNARCRRAKRGYPDRV